MQCIRGKQIHTLRQEEFAMMQHTYSNVAVDIGTGTGVYIHTLARNQPATLCIGVDACHASMRELSRKVRANELYVLANAECLPRELAHCATAITIHFPWGSLLQGLCSPFSSVWQEIAKLAEEKSTIEMQLNDSALQSFGYTAKDCLCSIRRALQEYGYSHIHISCMPMVALHVYPSRWAKKLSYGRSTCMYKICAKKE